MSYDSDVINATSGLGEANWDLIIKLCNRIRDSVGPTSMAQAMGSVLKRLKHSDPNVQLHALTLLEACVSNCGKSFQEELTKTPFQSEFRSIITGSYTDSRVTQRCKDLLVSWATEFKTTPGMNGLIRFLEQLKKDGISFQGLPVQQRQPAQHQTTSASNEDADLRKAIELSLRDSSHSTSAGAPPTSTGSFYPSLSPAPAKKEAKKVRAIYDFEAAEDNELSFRAGEIITVLDDSDENWWRGQTQLGTGLFPASFVSANLKVDPEPSQVESKESKKGKGSRKSDGKKTKKSSSKASVNTDKIDLFLDMIKGADVTSEENLAENETLMELEEECKKMRPLVDTALSELQKKEEEMQAINGKFEEALALYRKLLAEGPRLSSTAVNMQSTAAGMTGPISSSATVMSKSSLVAANNMPYNNSIVQQPHFTNSAATNNHLVHQQPHSHQLPPPPPYSSAQEMPSLYTEPLPDMQSGPSSFQQFQPPSLKSYPVSSVGMLSDPAAASSYTMHQQSLQPGSMAGLHLQQQPQQSLSGHVAGVPMMVSGGTGANPSLMGGAPGMVADPQQQQQAYNSNTMYQAPSQPPLL